MQFRKLKLGNMPRVFVRMLALDDEAQAVVEEAVDRVLAANITPHANRVRNTFAETLRDILDLSKEERSILVPKLNAELDELWHNDTFGTEGQLDPRGDRRR